MVAVTKKYISRKKSQRGGANGFKASKILPAEAQEVKPITSLARVSTFITPTEKTIASTKKSALSAVAGIPAAIRTIPTVGYEAGKFGVKLVTGVPAALPVLAYQGIKLWSKGKEINKARGFSESNVTKKLEEFQKKKIEWEKLQEKTNIIKKDVGLRKQKTAEQKLILNLTEKINRQSGINQTNKNSLNVGTNILNLLRKNDGNGGKGEFKTGDDLQKAISDGYKALAATQIAAYDKRQQNKVFKNTEELRGKKDKINAIIATKTQYIIDEKTKVETNKKVVKTKTQTYMAGIKAIEDTFSKLNINDPTQIKKIFENKNKAIEEYKNNPATKNLVATIQNLNNNILQSEYLIKRQQTILNPYQKELSEVENKISLYIPKKFTNLAGSYNRRRARLNKTKTYYKNIFTDPLKSVATTYRSVRDPLKEGKFKEAAKASILPKGIGKDIVSGITPSIGTYKVTNISNINIFDDTTKFNIFKSRTSKYVKLAELYEKDLEQTKNLSLDDRIKNKTQINKIYEYFNDKKDKYVDTLSKIRQTNGKSIDLYDQLINNQYSLGKENFQIGLDTQKQFLTSQINKYTEEYKNTPVKTKADKDVKQKLYNEQLQLINELRAITVLESFNKIQNIKKESDDLVTKAIDNSENRSKQLQQQK